jgi:hypothetical protein
MIAPLTLTRQAGYKAFKRHLETLKPKDGSSELWLKFGHDQLYVGDWDNTGQFALHKTYGKGNDRRRGQSVGNAFDFLLLLSQREEGGVFYIPTQPQGNPLAELVTSTDDIGIELDSVDRATQEQRYQQFAEITGLYPSVLLSSGGKSIHGHYKLNEHLPIEQASYLRRLTILAFRGDPVTERLHQPMRMAGFYRLEKQQYQELLYANPQAQYSYEEYLEGLQKWFAFMGWCLPDAIPDEWWSRQLRTLLVGAKNKLTEDEKVAIIGDRLALGYKAWQVQQEYDRQARAAKAERRAALGQLGEKSLIDLVAEAEIRLGSDAFNLFAHDWQWSGGKARGCCPFHQSQSGNSAWLSEKQNGIGWAFACYACTDNRKMGAFSYWLASKRGLDAQFPQKREYVELAIEFLQWAGVTIPESILHPPKKPKGFGASSKAIALPHYNLSYAPDVVSNSRYLGAIDVPEGEKLVLIRSAKGSGKTEAIVALVKQAQRQGRRTWVFTYREQLGQQLADRLGIGYREMIGGGMVLCIDSAHPNSEIHFTADRTQDDLVIIDEVESVSWHTLNSSTCAKQRQPILKEVRLLLQGVLSPASKGQVILADADLSDLSVDFIKGMADRRDLKPYVILNIYKPDRGYQAWSYQGAPDLWAAMRDTIGAGGKHLILTSGQRVDSKWGARNLEAALRAKFPDKRILRIDSSTIADPDEPAFNCTPVINELLKAYDIVIASTTIESGVSIDLHGHFSSVWAFLSGVQAENSVRQFLMRLRDLNVPRHIYVAPRGINNCFVGSGETEAKALLETEHRTAKANLRAIHDAAMSMAIDADGSIAYNVAAQEAWGKLGARCNAGLTNYRDAVLAGLKEEGHIVKDSPSQLSEEAAKAISKWLGDVRDGEHQIDCEARATAKPIASEEEYEALKNQKVKTEAERQSQARYELEQRYSVELTPELVMRDDGGWYATARMHYFLTIGREFVEERDRRQCKEIVDDVQRAWLPDANQRLIAGKIHKLQALGVDRLIEIAQTGERLYGTHPAIIAVAKAARADAAEVKLLLKVEATESGKDMSIAQELLELSTGRRMEKLDQQRTIDGKRQYLYFLPEFKDERSKIFAAWLKRDRDRVEQQQVQLEERAAAAKSKLSHAATVPTANDSPYIDIRQSVCSTHTGVTAVGSVEAGAIEVDEESIVDVTNWLTSAVELDDRSYWEIAKGVITELGDNFKQTLWQRLDRSLREAVYRFEGAIA